MSKPDPSAMPGVNSMADTMDFVKNMWGGLKMPGMVMPSLSVEDINKQIADLKAVESWLTLNMNMLRGTIQTLEVQSATLSTLQAMSATLSSVGKQDGKEGDPSSAFVSPFAFPSAASVPPTAASGAPAAPFADPAAWWNLLQDQFKQAVNTAMTTEAPTPSGESAAASPSKPAAGSPKRKPPKT